jgi:hypothetical protein
MSLIHVKQVAAKHHGAPPTRHGGGGARRRREKIAQLSCQIKKKDGRSSG